MFYMYKHKHKKIVSNIFCIVLFNTNILSENTAVNNCPNNHYVNNKKTEREGKREKLISGNPDE